MEKRLILAFILSLIVLYIFNSFFYPKPKKGEEKRVAQKREYIFSSEKKIKLSPPLIELKPYKEIEIKFNKNGDISYLYLSSFKEELFCSNLVKENLPLLAKLRKRSAGLKLTSPQANLKLGSYTIKNKREVIFYYKGEGEFADLEIEKKITFLENKPYFASVTLTFINHGTSILNLPSYSLFWQVPGGRLSKYLPYYTYNKQVYYIDDTKERVSYKRPGILSYLGIIPYFEPEEEVITDRVVDWVAYEKRHFVILFLPSVKQRGHFFKKDKEGLEVIGLKLPKLKLKGKEEKRFELLVYAGPAYHHILKKLGKGTGKLTGLNLLGIGILYLLKFLYFLSHNWGVAIILLTGIIKLILYPLTKKSLKATKDMQQLQPHLNKLRQMYKNDRAKLQEEIINLYKRYHVNPAAGCLPLILQLPIFIALYSTLISAVELKGAHFILWIKDLSSPDPLYILPLLMGGTSLLYQLKTIIDPQQKRMALLFTGVFTLIFLTFPAGLNLYWLTQNLLSIFETKILAERKKSPSYLTKKTSVQK